MKIKSAIFLASLISIAVGTLLTVQANISADEQSVTQEVPPSVLVAGNVHCISKSTLRLYDKALLDGKADYSLSMLTRGICSILTEDYHATVLGREDELVHVQVVLDDTEYAFWVLEGAVQ